MQLNSKHALSMRGVCPITRVPLYARAWLSQLPCHECDSRIMQLIPRIAIMRQTHLKGYSEILHQNVIKKNITRKERKFLILAKNFSLCSESPINLFAISFGLIVSVMCLYMCNYIRLYNLC